jgi:hypothetical protein
MRQKKFFGFFHIHLTSYVARLVKGGLSAGNKRPNKWNQYEDSLITTLKVDRMEAALMRFIWASLCWGSSVKWYLEHR